MTFFAPEQRSTPEELANDIRLLGDQDGLDELCSAVAGAVAILNENRQILYANRDFIALTGDRESGTLLGTRPGEAVGCVHAHEMPGGCGTAMHCRYCGAVGAILECLETGKRVEKETGLTIGAADGSGDLDLAISASPIVRNGRRLVLVTVRDNSDTRRRQIMERLFFHDILNSASGIFGALELLRELPDKNEGSDLIGVSLYSSSNLVEEVQTFRLITRAEQGDLEVRTEPVEGLALLAGAADLVRYHQIVRGKRIELDPESPRIKLETDPGILSRILVNMIKNALEATASGGEIRAGIRMVGSDRAAFYVWNDAVMEPEIKEQIFHKSFSTKGKDRGLGTWSILLFGERYLGGAVSFDSEEGSGTEFRLELDTVKEWT